MNCILLVAPRIWYALPITNCFGGEEPGGLIPSNANENKSQNKEGIPYQNETTLKLSLPLGWAWLGPLQLAQDVVRSDCLLAQKPGKDKVGRDKVERRGRLPGSGLRCPHEARSQSRLTPMIPIS